MNVYVKKGFNTSRKIFATDIVISCDWYKFCDKMIVVFTYI